MATSIRPRSARLLNGGGIGKSFRDGIIQFGEVTNTAVVASGYEHFAVGSIAYDGPVRA